MKNMIKLGDRTYCIEGSTNVGLYILNENQDVAIVDSGFQNNGPLILEILNKHKFNLKYILTTHVHADHCGANKFLMSQTGAKMVTTQIERAFARSDKLDIGFLYGGYPLEEFKTDLMHIDEHVDISHLSEIPEGIRSFRLPGHHYDMVGFKTSDNVYFIADSVGSLDTVLNHHILLVYDVEGYFNTLDYLEELDGLYVVPSHGSITKNISSVVKVVRSKMHEIIDLIIEFLSSPTTLEDLVKMIFDYYKIDISYNKYLIITSTIRSYLAYLGKNGKTTTMFIKNKLYYLAI